MAYTTVKTPIVYYGGKTSILNHIMPLIPPHEVYTETFFGGGTVFFAKDPAKNETINDRLDIVINFYRTLRSHFKPLKELIDATLIGRSIHNEALAIIRSRKNSELKAMDLNQNERVNLAWAFWVCTNFAYSNKIGGGYKYSNHQTVSVPHTLRKRKQQFTELLVDRIETTYIENDDAINVLRSRNTPAAFHYVDPPYPNADQGHYAGYTFDEYKLLLNFLANECTGKFLLSSYNSEMLDEFIQVHGWHKMEITHRIKAPRKTGTLKVEVLVRNYEYASNTPRLF